MYTGPKHDIDPFNLRKPHDMILQVLIAMVAGWVNRHQKQGIVRSQPIVDIASGETDH